MVDRKKIRERIGYTASGMNKDAASWLRLARGFRAAAEVLHDNSERVPNNTRPFALNAGYSLELLFKGLLAQNGLQVPNGQAGHDLVTLAISASVSLTENQRVTLEDFTEIIVWLGRYPGPKREERWDHYHDVLYEKNVVREKTVSGTSTVFSTRANPATFSNWENYERIWSLGWDKVDPKFKS